jgi:hypothetical protein
MREGFSDYDLCSYTGIDMIERRKVGMFGNFVRKALVIATPG